MGAKIFREICMLYWFTGYTSAFQIFWNRNSTHWRTQLHNSQMSTAWSTQLLRGGGKYWGYETREARWTPAARDSCFSKYVIWSWCWSHTHTLSIMVNKWTVAFVCFRKYMHTAQICFDFFLTYILYDMFWLCDRCVVEQIVGYLVDILRTVH